MPKSILGLMVLLGLSALCQAQGLAEQEIQTLLNNPAITWLGEVYRDHEMLIEPRDGRLDEFQDTVLSPEQHLQMGLPIKAATHPMDEAVELSGLARYCFEPDLKRYAEPQLNKPFALDEATKQDILAAAKIQVSKPIADSLLIRQVQAFRLREVWYFDHKQQILICRPLAIAPLIGEARQALFWSPLTLETKLEKPIARWQEIRWVTMTYQKEHFKPLKESISLDSCLELTIDYFLALKDETKFDFSEEFNLMNPNYLSLSEVQNKLFWLDSSLVFNPETFEEDPFVEEQKIQAKDLGGFRQVYLLAWDMSNKVWVYQPLGLVLTSNRRKDKTIHYYQIPYFGYRLKP